MPRKGSVAKRDVLPDPIYNSKLVTRLINKIMLDGKKGTAQNILYSFPFGFFVPYKERPCLLFSIPAQSSVPRTMWYLTPGKSLTRPPRIMTVLCSCKL